LAVLQNVKMHTIPLNSDTDCRSFGIAKRQIYSSHQGPSVSFDHHQVKGQQTCVVHLFTSHIFTIPNYTTW